MVLEVSPSTSNQSPTPSIASKASRTGPSTLIFPCDKTRCVRLLAFAHFHVLDLECPVLLFHTVNSSSFRIQSQLSLSLGNHPFTIPIKTLSVSVINAHNAWFNNYSSIRLSPQTMGILITWPIHFIFFGELMASCKFVLNSSRIYFVCEPPTTEVKNYVCLVHCITPRAWHSDWYIAGGDQYKLNERTNPSLFPRIAWDLADNGYVVSVGWLNERINKNGGCAVPVPCRRWKERLGVGVGD